MNKIILLVATLLLTWSVSAQQTAPKDDKVIVIKATIVGGKQAPKFLSIVPWRLQRQMTLDNQPLGLKQQEFKPLDPIELQQALARLQHNNF